MTTDNTRIAERMFDVLLDRIRSERPELLDEGFTVAEIYQNLVPYRSHRDRIGVEMNGDYEHALLRLLAGEGDYLEVGSEAARRRFRDELESVRPDTGIYRKFAAVEVRLNADRVPVATGGRAAAGGPGGGPEDGRLDVASVVREQDGAEERVPLAVRDDEPAVPDVSEVAPPEDASEASSPGAAPSSGGAEATTAGAAPGAADDGSDGSTGAAERRETCPWCRERFPDRADLRFCPYCGSRADLTPCPDCGTELEDDWLFCLACGAEVAD